jgi:flagellar L-ring protein precursor FlgH
MNRLKATASCLTFSLLLLSLGIPNAAATADLYRPGTWAALASDRPAAKVGDSLTVIIDEVSSASDSASSGTKKKSHVGAQIAATPSFNVAGSLDMGSGYSGSGQTQHTHKMVAQLSVVVDAVLPNGDLHVTGSQALKVNHEKTNIRLSGRVRTADIDSNNTVLSTRLADAVIDYDGSGFIDRNNRPGLFTRILSWIGLP